MSRPFLQLHLVDHCNLNCKGCAHFSPIAEEWYISIDEVTDMLTKLRPVMEKWFCRIELMGGEPLLHPKMDKIMDTVRNIYPSIEIRLVTNGLKLANMPNSFFSSCIRNNIIICISVYPVALDYNSIGEMLKKKGVLYKYYGEYSNSKEFICYKLDPCGEENPIESYNACKYAGHCVQLRHGKIYPCFIVAYIEHINKQFGLNFSVTENDYISLDSISDNEDIDYIFEKIFHSSIPFCRYCDTSRRKLYKWDYSTCDEKEWIINAEE